MSINGIGSHPPTGAGGGSPAGVMAELIQVLREARQASRETEVALSDQAILASEDRARLASDKAEAARHGALLQFCMSAGQAVTSIATGAVACRAGRAGEGTAGGDDGGRADRVGRICDSVASGAEQLVKVGTAANDAFGYGRQETELGAAMEQASTLEARLDAHQDRARVAREDIDEALADVRQAYRDVTSGQNGGA